MKRYLFLLLLLPYLVHAQKPVVWKVWAIPLGSDTYTIHVFGHISKGWHVYAQKDTAVGLEPLVVTFDNEALAINAMTETNMATPYKDPVFANRTLQVFQQDIQMQWEIRIDDAVPSSLAIHIAGFASNDKTFMEIKEVKQIELPHLAFNQFAIGRNFSKPINDCGEQASDDKGLLAVFILGIVGGLLALLTPCVFPVIPMTVSFFMKGSCSRSQGVKKGLLYGFFIFIIYLLASSPFHLIKGIDKNIFNAVATNAWVNLLFFVILILFSLSFFGLFEIRLPSGIANKADAKSNLGSVTGILFMALTLVVVSFSCTGVILGALLAGVAAEGPWALTAGMAGFGLALAVPFTLFAIFPHLLKAVPKSGSWLNTVKKVLAFAELALAFKFLSNADLVEHWGFLKREVFIGIWLLIALALTLYLFGFFNGTKTLFRRTNSANPLGKAKQKISPGRVGLGLVSFGFACYLAAGMLHNRFANLKILSGFLPPLSYSIYGNRNLLQGVEPKVINDFDKALLLAKKENKPLLIDFTGWACVNCRKMEEGVWTKPEVQRIINEEFILVSLYVDDRKKIQEGRFYFINALGEKKELKTVGEKWASFQAENFKQVTQPFYVLLSPGGALLNYPVGYTPDEINYRNWLQCGLNAFENEKRAVAGNREILFGTVGVEKGLLSFRTKR